MKKLVINGQFTARRMTGQERFAYEIVSQLDRIIDDKDIFIELLVPINAINIPVLKNIKIVKYGKIKGSLWEQVFLFVYLFKHKAVSLNLCSIMPILRPGIICIHDLSYKVNPQYFTTRYAKISQLWHKIQYYFAWHFSPIIFTVSEFSKQQMIETYHVPTEKIVVIGNGWEHFKNVVDNDDFEKKNSCFFSKPFFFSLGSLAPNKNITWILEVAKRHPQYNFLVAGSADLKAYGHNYQDQDFSNVIFLGYISDEDIKTLMKKCIAFIFPSYFEGFGIPPLEALSVGAKIIVANTTCLPEIFGSAAYYINPYDANINLDDLLCEKVADPKSVLEKYTFEKSAITIFESVISYL